MARAQLFLALGIVIALAGILYLLGGHWVSGVPLAALGLLFVVQGLTRMLQLTGRLRDPAPWERQPH
jgi:uncharacterized protein YjeT (DUF2065 family)